MCWIQYSNGYWNNTNPTSTVLSLGNLIAGNGQSVVYAWHNVDGLQRGNTKATAVLTKHLYTKQFRPRLFVQKEQTAQVVGEYGCKVYI